jgi:rhodanese-related sulfurtransferase
MKRLALLCVAFLVASAWSFAAEDKGFPDISHADLKAAIGANKVTLIDCNGAASYAKGHIPGALDFNTIKESLADKLPKDKDALIVSYCGGPKCGAYKAGANAAQELGYTNVKHYSAGISGWKDAGETCEEVAKQTVDGFCFLFCLCF